MKIQNLSDRPLRRPRRARRVPIGGAVGTLATILTYVGAALFLALGLDPLVTWLEKHKVPRWLAILTVLVGVLGVFAGLVFALIPVIVEQVNQPGHADQRLIVPGIQDGTLLEGIQDNLPVASRSTTILDQSSTSGSGQETITSSAAACSGRLGIASGVVRRRSSCSSSCSTSWHRSNSIKRGLYQLVPASKRPRFVDIAEQISDSVGRYVIGQVDPRALQRLFAAASSSSIFVGAVSTRPCSRSSPSCSRSSRSWEPSPPRSSSCSAPAVQRLQPAHSSWSRIWYLVYMQVEAYVLNPRIMKRAVKVPGVVVVIAALAGGTLLGILGALIAIPVAAAVLLIINAGDRAAAERALAGLAADRPARSAAAAPPGSRAARSR